MKKSDDLLKMINDEVEQLTPKKPSPNITSTPIKMKKDIQVSSKVKTPHKSFFKTKAFSVICASLVFLAMFTGVLVPVLLVNGKIPTVEIVGTTYMSVDINPGVDFVLDEYDRVIQVISRNNDGDILLSNKFNEELVGKDVDKALKMMIDKATSLGYIDATSRPDQVAGSKVNAIKINIANDNKKKTNKLTEKVNDITSSYMKEKGIVTVVGVKALDKKTMLEGTKIGSINELNKKREDQDPYHYISLAVGKNNQEIAKIFKEEFIGEFIEDEFDDMLEDIDDVVDLVGDIEELMLDYDALESELLPLTERLGYFANKQKLDNNATTFPDDLVDIMNEIAGKIDDYNTIIASPLEGINVHSLFRPIDNKANYLVIKNMCDKYDESTRAHIEDLLERLEKNIQYFDMIVSAIDGVFTGFDGIVSELRAEIDAKLEIVNLTIEEYNAICEAEIKSTYDKLMHQNNDVQGNVKPEDYDQIVDSILGDMDFDEFWEQNKGKVA